LTARGADHVEWPAPSSFGDRRTWWSASSRARWNDLARALDNLFQQLASPLVAE
jgi:hypothetical protein